MITAKDNNPNISVRWRHLKVGWIALIGVVILILAVSFLIRADKKQAVIANYTKVIKASPKIAVAYNDRGKAYLNQDKYDKAILDFTLNLSFKTSHFLGVVHTLCL